MKSLDIRSEPAIRLLSEFLDMDSEHGHERAKAEHFAHGESMMLLPFLSHRACFGRYCLLWQM